MFRFAKAAVDSLASRRVEGEERWKRLVLDTVATGKSPPFEAIRSSATQYDDMSTDQLLALFERDCTLASEYAYETNLIGTYRSKASKCREPKSIEADVAALRKKLATLEQELAESEQWHSSVSHVAHRLLSMQQDRPDLFSK
jgi:hypothetical protein